MVLTTYVYHWYCGTLEVLVFFWVFLDHDRGSAANAGRALRLHLGHVGRVYFFYRGKTADWRVSGLGHCKKLLLLYMDFVLCFSMDHINFIWGGSCRVLLGADKWIQNLFRSVYLIII